ERQLFAEAKFNGEGLLETNVQYLVASRLGLNFTSKDANMAAGATYFGQRAVFSAGVNYGGIMPFAGQANTEAAKQEQESHPKLSKIELRDYKTLQEVETLVSRSSIDDGPLCTWLGTIAFVESPNDEFSVIQTIVTRHGGGAPFVDLNGKLVGYLSGIVGEST